MPNKDRTGPDGKGRPGKGQGPCSSRKGNEKSSSNDNFPNNSNRKRRGNK